MGVEEVAEADAVHGGDGGVEGVGSTGVGAGGGDKVQASWLLASWPMRIIRWLGAS